VDRVRQTDRPVRLPEDAREAIEALHLLDISTPDETLSLPAEDDRLDLWAAAETIEKCCQRGEARDVDCVHRRKVDDYLKYAFIGQMLLDRHAYLFSFFFSRQASAR
jgi:hypothetical protein